MRALLCDQREPLVEGQALDVERRQPRVTRQLEPFVADDRKRHLVPLCELDLVVECLGAEPGDARSERASSAL